MFWCQIRRSLSGLLLLGAIVLALLLGLGGFGVQSAAAMISELEEAPGQMLYQSRQTLRDPQGNFWQAIVFKRVKNDRSTDLSLRVVGFPGIADIDQTRPLSLSTSLGKTFEIPNASQDIFEDRPVVSPITHIAQYNLQPILPQLNPAIPLAISIPSADGSFVKFSISPQILQEWKTIVAKS